MSTGTAEPHDSAAGREPAGAGSASTDPAPAELRTLGGWMAVRGLLGVVFGLAMVFWPREQIGSPANLGIPVATVDNLLIAYFALAGILVLVHGLRTRSELRTPLLGEAVVVLPALVFLVLADTSAQLRAAVAVWAVLHGVLELWLWRQQRGLRMRSDFLISAAVHLALGVIVLSASGMGALTVFGFTGAAALIVGVFFLVGGYSRRSLARQADQP
ncbi:HdeD family acid-resistance protein [Brevibacterium album]|uniref:HdeD family acid-resistance protein n=1 Tax=Brevibacterium album TaxID=417948 RepID=UPI00041A1962|nr:hypothetical protein [Brevibacterium album]